MSQTFVIVGGGLAGAKAAEALRDEGHDGPLVLLGEESELPYERPPLSKDYLRGESPREKTHALPDDFYAENDVDLRLAVLVTELDHGSNELVLADGERIGYDRVLLATGAAPRRLAIEGGDLSGVQYLRDLGDSDAIAARLTDGGRVAVIGAGWIGSEVAASARQKGLEVTLIEHADVPLERVLGRQVGQIYADIHRDHGVELLTGQAVEAFEGTDSVEAVRLAGGRRVECDFVVVGVGVAPRVELAEAAGLSVDNGIVVDERLETSAGGIFAAGDVANAWHPFYETHIRVEHWANALNQPHSAALGMLDKDASYDRLPYFFSDQYEVGMEYTGYATEWDQVVLRGDVAKREFIAFWLKDGRVLAGMNVGVWDVTDPIKALITSRRRVDARALADPDVPLERAAETDGSSAHPRLTALEVTRPSPR
jgi:3-phenylpropionate/trans-cinnamate dioxygenase ferredoxin reductase subunit